MLQGHEVIQSCISIFELFLKDLIQDFAPVIQVRWPLVYALL